MPKISVCKNCNDLISDFEALHYEGHCFYCAEELEEMRAVVGRENEAK